MRDQEIANQKEQTLRSFEAQWPFERLEDLTPKEYCLGGSNKQDNFSYWVEKETGDLGAVGGIGGGGSFKHGIFYVNQKSYDSRKHLSDGQFAWVRKYGENATEAFRVIKGLLAQDETFKQAMLDTMKRLLAG